MQHYLIYWVKKFLKILSTNKLSNKFCKYFPIVYITYILIFQRANLHFLIMVRPILPFIFFYGLVSFSRKLCQLQSFKSFLLCSRKYLDLTSCISIIGQGDFSLPAQLSWHLYQKFTRHVYVSQFWVLNFYVFTYIYLYAKNIYL